ncbi:FAD/NAD(P)-binding domain-containing protein [Sarocladium strictum]
MDSDDDFDLICVGFGPASLAIAVAMHDAIASGRDLAKGKAHPKVLFIEKQDGFAWHAGMLLPGAKMQISFVKDLATLRDPRSEFTFLNYLHSQGRLVDFTNLDTFLPARIEYEDYMRWAASAFSHVVQYGHQVVGVTPEVSGQDATRSFVVQARDVTTGEIRSSRARNVLIAAGGQPSLPPSLPAKHSRVIHSSQYALAVPRLLTDPKAHYRVAVIGAGQSAAEIFNNIRTLYPNSETRLVMRPEFLKPSDDSPFVNSVFNPEYVDMLYPKSANYRKNFITEARATNYGVVRLELIEHIYEHMYEQRRELGRDDRNWPHRIMGGRKIISVEPTSEKTLQIKAARVELVESGLPLSAEEEETWEADLVIAATGYRRDAHIDMLRDTWEMLPEDKAGKFESGWSVQSSQGQRRMAVGRDYKVKYEHGRVAEGSGVWLQGCCEATHGLSDTLLSVLATRSGEMVDSLFGKDRQ